MSQKRSAIPGLAKVLLAVTLLLCLGFAYWVQRYKQERYGLVLDRTIRLSTRQGDMSIKVSSQWKELPAENLRRGMIAGWTIPLPGTSQSGSLFLDMVGRQVEQQQDILAIIGRYVPVNRVDLGTMQVEEGMSVNSLATIDVGALYLRGRSIEALVMKLINLPDGTSMVILTMGPNQSVNMLGFWLDKIAGGLDFQQRTPKGRPREGVIKDAQRQTLRPSLLTLKENAS